MTHPDGVPFETDEMADRLAIEFRDDVQDRLDLIYHALNSGLKSSQEEVNALLTLKREAAHLRGVGTSFGNPLVSLIAQRLAVYLTGLDGLTEKRIAQLTVFADRMATASERDRAPDLVETNHIIKSLPVRYEFDVTDVEVRDVEIMLVTPTKTVSRFVAKELLGCGYRPLVIHDPIEAIGLAVRMPPDMIIASAVMQGLGGLDLIRAIKAMEPTSHVPAALLTSMDRISLAAHQIPPGMMVIHTGAKFGEDFAAAIAEAEQEAGGPDDAARGLLGPELDAGVREVVLQVSVRDGAENAQPGAFDGVTVQPMIRLEGYELIVGCSQDAQFGPVLLFGSGGQLVEVYRDSALGLPPLNTTLARRMMEQTQIYEALQGVRGRGAVDMALLESLLVRFSQIVAEQPWIKEMDINPLLADERARKRQALLVATERE